MTAPGETAPISPPSPGPLDLSPDLRSDFAVVIPAYNEAPVVADLIAELRETFRRHDLRGEIVIVDDGSTDDTVERIHQEADGWAPVRVLSHRVNRGKTEAMVTAAEATTRTWLVLFDADLQHATEEIPRFLEKLQEGWDIVVGRKVGHYDKRAVSSVYNRLSHAIFKVPVSDLNSMKAFRREKELWFKEFKEQVAERERIEKLLDAGKELPETKPEDEAEKVELQRPH